MTNDAKLGLVVGVGLVIVVAVVFFRKDLTPGGDVTVTTSGPGARPVRGQPTSYQRQAAPADIRHTVRDGETLESLARQYYGDSSRAVEIYEANRTRLNGADQLPAGAELLIPEPVQTALARP